MFAVGQHKHRQLDTTEELFDDHTMGGCAELGGGQHLFQLMLGFLQVVQYQHTLAGGKAVSLQHVGGFERGQELLTLFQGLGGESAIRCRGDTVALHELLGKILAAFQHGTLRLGADNHHVLQVVTLLKIVSNTGH